MTTKKLFQTLHERMPEWMNDWLDLVVPAFEVLLIVIGAWLLMRVARLGMRRLTAFYSLPLAIAGVSLRVVGLVVYGGAALWALERMGVSGAVLWTAFTGFATVGAVAFFAAWSVLSNLFCALLIYTTRAFRIGDMVELIESGEKVGVKGRVLDINLVYTTLLESGEGRDGVTLQLPNTLFFQRILRRWHGEAALRPDA